MVPPRCHVVTHPLSVLIVLAVGVVSAALAIMGALAARRTGDNKLWFVTAAFLVFAAKGFLTSLSLWKDLIGHEDLEMVGAVMEFTAVILLVAPFLRR